MISYCLSSAGNFNIYRPFWSNVLSKACGSNAKFFWAVGTTFNVFPLDDLCYFIKPCYCKQRYETTLKLNWYNLIFFAFVWVYSIGIKNGWIKSSCVCRAFVICSIVLSFKSLFYYKTKYVVLNKKLKLEIESKGGSPLEPH